MNFFDSPEEEDYIFSQVDLYRQRHAETQRSTNLRTAELVAAYRDQYPWLKPGVVLPLAKAGLGPDSRAAQLVAQRGAKKKAGFGWHSIGDAVSATGRGISGGVSAVERGVASVAKPVVRTAFTALDAGYEELQGAFRTTVHGVVGAGHVRGPSPVAAEQQTKSPLQGEGFVGSQSKAGIAVEHLIHGEPVDLGSGILPGGKIAEEQAERARQSLSIDGHAVTPGRLVAHAVTEPGTTPYNALSGLVDLSVAIYADPAAKGLGKSSEAREAAKLFAVRKPSAVRQLIEGAGGVKGVRPAVIGDVVESYLDSAEGRKVVDHIAGETNWDTLWKTFKKKIPVETVNDLTDAQTPDEVRAILRDVLGVEVREKPYRANFLTRAVKPVGGFGIGLRKRADGIRMLQTMPGSHLDLDDIDSAVEQLDRYQKNAKLPAEVIGKNNERLARATSRPEAFKVVTDTATDIAEHIHGMPRSEARNLTKLFTDYDKEYARYFVDEIGENAHVPGAVIDGAGNALPTPHLYVEYLNGTIPLPNVREIKRATSTLGQVYNLPGVEPSIAFLDAVQQKVWKPFVLLRGAWTVRVVGEEQVRMAGAGLDSVFRHPISAVSRMVGERGHTGITGELLSDAEEARSALTRGTMGFVDRPDVIRTQFKTLYERGHPEYVNSWGDEVAQLAADPVAKRVAQDAEATKAWFWDGAGQGFRKDMAAQRAELLDRATSDAYIDSVHRRIQVKTAEQPELVDAIATGRINGEAVADGNRLSKSLRQHLQGLAEGEIGPVKVKGDLLIATKRKTAAYDKAVESLFNTLMSRPTNYLSRSKAFEQFYWKRAEELAGHLDADAQFELLENARKAKLNSGQIKRLEGAVKRASGDLDLEHADEVAKGFALDSTRDLLYDISEKSQWADAVRLIMPFAEAWKEILTRWARIGYEHPETIRRGQQIVQGARGAGFFYKSPQSQEEVFAYPGSAFVNEKLLGIPLPLEGSVSGLNLFSQSVIPGVGPVVQIPAAALLPDKPEWDEVRKLIFPAGEIEGPLPSALLPSWFKKVQAGFNGPESDRLFNNTVMDIAAYLKSTGEYDTGSEDGIDKLLTDAKKKARWLYVIRGFTQFGAPTAPQPLEVVEDKDGRVHAIRQLSDEFHEKEDKIGYQEAVAWFLERYGENAAQVLQSKTEGGGPPTKAGFDFVREHPEIARKYPEVYGYFLPKEGDIDFAAYGRQLDSGERKPLDKKEQIHRANSRIAIAMYQQAKSRVSANPTKEERAWLRDIKSLLVERYPGFEPAPQDMGRTDRKIRALKDLVDDPAVADTDAAQGLKLYFQARSRALKEAEVLGLASGFSQAKKAEPIRDWLRDIGELLAKRYPDFAPMWDDVLDREMKQDAA